MKNYHLTFNKDEFNGWQLNSEDHDEEIMIVFPPEVTKEHAVKMAAAVMNIYGNEIQSVSLKIHNLDGTFEEERTYPGSADPEESKG